MSATNVPNRKGVTRPRNADDFYATPSWVTRAILPHLGPYTSALDPCCGDGAILRELRGELHGIETDGGRALACVESDLRLVHMVNNHDALVTQWPAVDLIITNPPFALAMEFLKLALEESGGRGEVAFLLRLAFLEGQARAAFHRAHPSDVYVLPKRPSFTGDGKSDSCAYAWFVFGPGRGGRWSVLDCEPAKRGRS